MEGEIDKVDFDPRIGEIKTRLTVCLEQIAEEKSQESGQVELFLIVYRLGKLANSVCDRLSSLSAVRHILTIACFDRFRRSPLSAG